MSFVDDEIEDLRAERLALLGLNDELVHTVNDLELELLARPRPRTSKRATLLYDAGELIEGNRDGEYGTPEDNLGRIADLWSVLFERVVEPRTVALAMVLVKVARDVHAPKRDNLVDGAGYFAIADEVTPE